MFLWSNAPKIHSRMDLFQVNRIQRGDGGSIPDYVRFKWRCIFPKNVVQLNLSERKSNRQAISFGTSRKETRHDLQLLWCRLETKLHRAVQVHIWYNFQAGSCRQGHETLGIFSGAFCQANHFSSSKLHGRYHWSLVAMGHAWDVKYLTTVSILVGSVVIIITLPETNIAPAKRKLHLPTINFQGRAVSFRAGIIIIICGLDQSNIPAHDTPSPFITCFHVQRQAASTLWKRFK